MTGMDTYMHAHLCQAKHTSNAQIEECKVLSRSQGINICIMYFRMFHVTFYLYHDCLDFVNIPLPSHCTTTTLLVCVLPSIGFPTPHVIACTKLMFFSSMQYSHYNATWYYNITTNKSLIDWNCFGF